MASRLFNSFFGKRATTPPEAQFKNYEPKPSTQQVSNAMAVDSSGQGGASDFGFNADIGFSRISNPAQAQRYVETMYYTDWQAQKIIDLPVEDMLREPWEYITASDRDFNKKMTKYAESIHLDKVLRQALSMERLYGGSVIFMGVKDYIDDPALPIDPALIDVGDLTYLNPISRYHISNSILQLDPTKPGYGRPSWYMIYGHKVHSSRLLIFDGEPIQPLREGAVPAVYNMIRDGFGYPLLLRIKDDLVRATGSRQAACHLMQRASMMLFTGDIQTASVFKDAEGNVQALQAILNNMSNYHAALINSVPGSQASLENISANFGAVPELIQTFLQVCSAACDIPVTRFLGRSSAGLNATGEGDLENYYNMIEAKQRKNLMPQLAKLLKVMVPSAGFNAIRADDVEIKFQPLWNASELEDAQTRQIDVNNIVSLISAGVISAKEGVDELKQRELLVTNPLDYPAPEQPMDTDGVDDDKVKGTLDKIGTKDASRPAP
jgi:hypothetical protein